MITKNVTKFVVAVALTLAVTLGSGVVGEHVGLELAQTAFAGNCTGNSGGGGC